MRYAAEAEMIKINDQLVPAEMLTPELRRKLSIAQSRKIPNEIATLMDEVQKELAAHLLLRNAPKKSVTTIGLTEKDATAHGATFRSLSAKAGAEADKEKEKEGVKDHAGKTRCPLCGK